MIAFRAVRGVATNEQKWRPFTNLPWMLVRVICLAILARGWAASCWAEERPVIENSIGMKLVSIPAGEFLMGGTEEEVTQEIEGLKKQLLKAREKPEEQTPGWIEPTLKVLESEKPQHRVAITKPFFLGKFEVTQKQFSVVMGWNPSVNSATSKKRDMAAGLDTSLYPVEHVSWENAGEFCRQLSALPDEKAAGRTYRLPTEAEWEYGCRAGTGTKWYWGDSLGPKYSLLREYAWFDKNSDQHPHPVGQKRPNPWGLFDMIGNVSEWCADWYDPKTYVASSLRDPAGPTNGTERTARGGAYNSGSIMGRSAFRGKHPPIPYGDKTGFRVACEVSGATPQVVETTPATTGTQDLETRLKEKGLSRRMGYFLLPEEAQFIRYVTTIERLRMSCYHAQKECQEAQQQVARAKSVKAGAVQARMQARNYAAYSETWREHWASVRATNNASDAVLLANLSKEGLEKWQQDAQADLDSAVELFAGQIDKLQKMYQQLQKDYSKLYEDKTVKHTLAEANSQGKTTYRIGPTPSAAAAMKKLEHEQGLLAQFKKQ